MNRLLPLGVLLVSLTACKSWGKFWQTEIVYPSNPLLVTQNVAMAPTTPTMPGSAAACSVSPPLPDGLSLASDCTISGTPTRGQGTLSYRVTADIGSDTVAGDVRIRVLFQPRFAYAANIVDANITAFTINSASGALTLIGSYAAGTGARFVLRDMSGKYIYVANTNGSNISGFAIDQSTGSLNALAGSPFATSSNPYSLATDPAGKFLYVGHENAGVAAVSAYTITAATGSLVAVSGSPFAAAVGATPVSVYVSPDGKHLYVGSSQSGVNPNTFVYSIDQGTGALTALAGSPFGAMQNAISVFVHPTGKYVYYAQYNGGTVGYLRDAATGSVSSMATSPFSTGSGPGFVLGDIEGRFLFVANSGDAIGTSGVTVYMVGSGGALSQISGSPFTSGKNPIGIAIDETSRFVYVVGSYTAGIDATSVAVAGSNP